MKKVIVCLVALVLGVCATQLFGQEVSVLVKPKPQLQRVDVVTPYVGVHVRSQYVWVQPRPYLVTPYVVLPPPKPIFGTPLRDELWRKTHRPRWFYHVQPAPNQ